MKMVIEHRLIEKIPEIVAVESVPDEQTGLELNQENIEMVLEELRPYLVGAAGATLELVAIEEPIVKVRITGACGCNSETAGENPRNSCISTFVISLVKEIIPLIIFID
ncbi:hypothetical protein K7X08_033923 [Anisodus acutangulus]|uniref:NIF system FeS cluster assembly NifU C-terminal domain-containing protein n=1 Tax=Anisodus acutangulus TaxID=402998 RepID=A0A9Q1MW93_9SOLA|nr:hypothetical protein K7X08_033923 [Anisodus acutangulus]